MQYDPELVELFQDYCTHHETVYHYSPLTSKIYTLLLFTSSSEGVTFDEIVEKLNASKSSVSNSLNILVNSNQVEHFNKIDERKRYFRVNPEYLTNRLYAIKEGLEKELLITHRLYKFNQEKKIRLYKCCDTKMDIYLEHLEQASKSLTDTIERLKNSN